MKHSALAGMFITAALLASPVFAADKDLCDGNIQKLEDAASSGMAIGENSAENIKAALDKAKAAKAAGNEKDCIAVSGGMLEKIQVREPSKG